MSVPFPEASLKLQLACLKERLRIEIQKREECEKQIAILNGATTSLDSSTLQTDAQPISLTSSTTTQNSTYYTPTVHDQSKDQDKERVKQKEKQIAVKAERDKEKERESATVQSEKRDKPNQGEAFTWEEWTTCMRVLSHISRNPLQYSEHINQLHFIKDLLTGDFAEQCMSLVKRHGSEQTKAADDRALRDMTYLRRLHYLEIFKLKESLPKELLDGEEPTTPLSALAKLSMSTEPLRLGSSIPLLLSSAGGGDSASERDASPDFLPQELLVPGSCMQCRSTYTKVHFFYDKFCPACATMNWQKRGQKADLKGRVALVTGGRLKIGYEAVLILLRCGATVIATTRFPIEAAHRFAREEDYEEWKDRLQIFKLEMKDIPAVEKFAAFLNRHLHRLDMIINNAAQTISRPVEFYHHLLSMEQTPIDTLPSNAQDFFKYSADWNSKFPSKVPRLEFVESVDSPSTPTPTPTEEIKETDAEDEGEIIEQRKDDENNNFYFPHGMMTLSEEQVDLRETNSWRLTLEQVSTKEFLEVQVVNTVAPFVLTARLRDLMKRSPILNTTTTTQPNTTQTTTKEGKVIGPEDQENEKEEGKEKEKQEREKEAETNLEEQDPGPMVRKFIINVSAMEGQFYRFKTERHPHTNMAKAALNMMTRTSASGYAKDGIYMNSVDTGWVTDENPLPRRMAKGDVAEMFSPPLDAKDGAARVLDPILTAVNGGPIYYGLFFKDYKITHW